MFKQLEIFVIFAILTDLASVFTLASPQGTGQKAHFSLQDTPGSFSVHANKMLAKVSSKPDSIKVIVKPGMAEFPVPQLPTQKPLVHVASPAIVRPVGGFNFMNLGRKRSRVETEKKSFGKKDRHQKFFRENVMVSEFHSKIGTSVGKSEKLGKKWLRGGKKNLLKSVDKVDGNEKHFGKNLLTTLTKKIGVGKSVTLGDKRTKTEMHRRVFSKSEDVKVKPGEKRELVERKMKVKGGTGTFSVHVDKKMSRVSSATGGVNVFINNPSPKQISQLPREMLQLPGVMLQLPNGMSQLYSRMPQLPASVSQFTKGISQLPREKPWVLVRLPYDWTGASNWQEEED